MAPDDAADQALTTVTAAVGDPASATERLLAALVAMRQLRGLLDTWEPELIAAARAGGASWAQLADALGVASRQAAERRYLRLAQGNPGSTGDERVQAVRDRRAAERAVTDWAHDNGADLRQLAGQITALTDLGAAARPCLDRLHAALGGADTAELVPLLAATQQHLPPGSGLASRVADVGKATQAVRRDTGRRRAARN